MKIISADFVISAAAAAQFPGGPLPEFAFAGRSNVGKSSLINSLVARKNLVKTSATPGKTQMINFFRVNGQLMFADLPGYGFAKVPMAVKERWRGLIESYLLQRQALRAVVFIIDIRRDPTALDLELQAWLEDCGIGYVLVATKSDKLGGRQKKEQLEKIRETFGIGEAGDLIAYSSHSGAGRDALWRWLLARAAAAE